MTPPAKTRLVKQLAHDVGFDRVGVTDARQVEHVTYYRGWLAAGYAGSMAYLARNVRFRSEPLELLPGARSIICVALSYHRPEPPRPSHTGADRAEERPKRQGPVRSPAAASAAQPSPAVPQTADSGESLRRDGRVAQYARGRDYHAVLRQMLTELTARLRLQIAEPFKARVMVDTAPVLEKELARAAGLGWMGKHTLILHEKIGSYLFLGEVLTTLELTPDEPVVDHCGNCTRCLDACPTKAFPAPYQLDASRCLAYFTIEQRGPIPDEFHEALGDWVFGCDICQQVCPFNSKAPAATHPEIRADLIPARVDLHALISLRSSEYRRLTQHTAARRASRRMWQRNATIALANAERTSQPEPRP